MGLGYRSCRYVGRFSEKLAGDNSNYEISDARKIGFRISPERVLSGNGLIPGISNLIHATKGVWIITAAELEQVLQQTVADVAPTIAEFGLQQD
jgi:hypothetical protein